ncbi:MAG: DegT/DnrJ/EryC1/StrS aminotransferase family protein [Clostridiaceae bacterium]
MPNLKPIGGEPWFDTNLFCHDLNNLEQVQGTFLSGGQSSLNFIVMNLHMKEDEMILLPSFLCPTIVQNLERHHVKYDFYAINLDLSINRSDLQDKIANNKVKAVFFIDYFGFYHQSETLEYLKSLQEKNIILIEDAAQMLWLDKKEFIGDFTFNSYRKFLPIDGSIVLSDKTESYKGKADEYYALMNEGRMKITAYVKYGLGKVEDFVELFSKADEVYGKTTEINGMMQISRQLLNELDIDYIGKIRRRNYGYLFDRLCEVEHISPLFDKNLLGDQIPIGLPVLIKDRNRVRKELRTKAIYCPAHWPLLKERWIHDYKDSITLAENLMTLPIDVRYDLKDLDRLITELLRLVW